MALKLTAGRRNDSPQLGLGGVTVFFMCAAGSGNPARATSFGETLCSTCRLETYPNRAINHIMFSDELRFSTDLATAGRQWSRWPHEVSSQDAHFSRLCTPIQSLSAMDLALGRMNEGGHYIYA